MPSCRESWEINFRATQFSHNSITVEERRLDFSDQSTVPLYSIIIIHCRKSHFNDYTFVPYNLNPPFSISNQVSIKDKSLQDFLAVTE